MLEDAFDRPVAAAAVLRQLQVLERGQRLEHAAAFGDVTDPQTRLNSSSETWDSLTDFFDDQYGLNFGGRFDFCLNYTGNYDSANTKFYPDSGADLAFFTNPNDTTQIKCGDYYCVNFDVGNDGSVFPSSSSSYYVESNEAAIVKQGIAVKWAVYYVLQKTGRDKVILMGHSMGGLASREYLQNRANWQPDGQCHVAKLVTTGTPHGGSNSSLTEPIDWCAGIDDQSEAVRDLKTSFSYSGAPGVYLFGGVESDSVMNGMLFSDYYNVDVNCNGVIGDTITGLNKKNIHTDLDYSCIIGECTGCPEGNPGDGVVMDTSANINYYYKNLTTNLFYYYAFDLIEIHTDLPSQIYQNMQGLDEPNEYPLAYHVGLDTNYMGFTTVQADTSTYDYDDYQFSVPFECNISVTISNIYLSDIMAHIVDLSGSTIGTIVHSAGSSSIHFSQPLTAGKYYLQIYGMPTDTSYLHPYNFIINKGNPNGIIAYEANDMQIYPNPVCDNLEIRTSLQIKSIEITDLTGRLVYISNYKTIDCSNLSNGVLFYKSRN